MSLESFISAYIECALWSTTDDDDIPLDSAYTRGHIADESMAQIQAECAAFYVAHCDWFTREHCSYRGCPVDEYAGHDFWLTRNGHGCGFWDGDWSDAADAVLTPAAKAAGPRTLVVGDDGQLHLEHG